MKFTANLCIALLILATSTGESFAGSEKSVNLDIVGIDEDSKKCGITEDSLRSRAILTLRQYGFSISKISNPYLEISANTVALSQLCATTIRVQFIGFTDDDLGKAGLGWVSTSELRYTVIAGSESIMTGTYSDYRQRLLDDIEDKIKDVLGKVQY
jgi:hypothetical protein